jgi:(2Fe-2S) ferredoxin
MTRVTYGNIGVDMVPRLIEEHLVKGRIVQDWVVARLGPEGVI